MCLQLAGAGLSVVGPDQELLYVCLTAIRMRTTASAGRFTLEAALQVRLLLLLRTSSHVPQDFAERAHAFRQSCPNVLAFVVPSPPG